jgi:(p)ppGpp synthase/HD superfamily hydrolase
MGDEIKSDRVFDAIEFSARAHRGQFRKGTEVPYLIHPLMVAKTLMEIGSCEDVVIAGLLHDTIEDTAVTADDIEQRFGKAVAELVQAVSEPEKSEPWEKRKERTLDAVRKASLHVALIEIADKLDNVRAISEAHARLGEAVWSRFNRPREQQAWYYRALSRIFADRADGEPILSLMKAFSSEVEKVFGKEQPQFHG